MGRVLRTVLAAGLVLGGLACDVGRNPDDRPLELVGIFDPDELGPPVGGLVDLSVSFASLLPLVTGQAVFGDLALLPLPEPGTCFIIDSIRPRVGVTSLEFDDGGDFIGLESAAGSFFIGRDTAQEGRYLQLKFGATSFVFDNRYDVNVPGGEDLPPFRVPATLRTPEDFQVTNLDLGSTIPVVRGSGQDLRIDWTPSSNPDDRLLIRIQAETKDEFRQVQCSELETGTIVIPSPILDQLPESEAALLVSRVTEILFDLPDGRRAAATGGINRVGTLDIQ